MSRDISELRVYQDSQKKIPKLIFLTVHLKSKLDPEGVDEKGNLRREAELRFCVDIYLSLKEKFPHCPIILAGDFNGVARASHNNTKTSGEKEFEDLFNRTNLNDILECLNLPESERTTFPSFDRNKKAQSIQLDYLFLAPKEQELLNPNESGIYRYRDLNGLPLALPQSPFEHHQLPSDHYPLVAHLPGLLNLP